MDENEVVEYAKKLLIGEIHTCECCGHQASEYKELDSNPVTFDADPFAEEIRGDPTPLWECASCRHDSAMDI